MSRKTTRDTTKAERPVSGFGRAKDRLDAKMLELLKVELHEAGRAKEAEAAYIEPFTIHDLRRTAATGMARLNIAPHIVDKILNHGAARSRALLRSTTGTPISKNVRPRSKRGAGMSRD